MDIMVRVEEVEVAGEGDKESPNHPIAIKFWFAN